MLSCMSLYKLVKGRSLNVQQNVDNPKIGELWNLFEHWEMTLYLIIKSTAVFCFTEQLMTY